MIVTMTVCFTVIVANVVLRFLRVNRLYFPIDQNSFGIVRCFTFAILFWWCCRCVLSVDVMTNQQLMFLVCDHVQPRFTMSYAVLFRITCSLYRVGLINNHTNQTFLTASVCNEPITWCCIPSAVHCWFTLGS